MPETKSKYNVQSCNRKYSKLASNSWHTIGANILLALQNTYILSKQMWFRDFIKIYILGKLIEFKCENKLS